MVTDNQLRKFLDQDTNPVMIVSQWLLVYANPALQQLLGYQSWSQLEASGLLDITEGLSKQAVKNHFEAAPDYPDATLHQVALKLKKSDGSIVAATMSSQALNYDSEQAYICYVTQDLATVLPSPDPAFQNDSSSAFENDSNPAAIIQEGIIACATPAFLNLLGYGQEGYGQAGDAQEEFIGATPLLDVVCDADAVVAKEILSQPLPEPAGAVHTLGLIASNGQVITTTVSSRRTLLNGQPARLLTFAKWQQPTLPSRLKGRPWALYLAILCLVFAVLAPVVPILNLTINNVPKVYLPADAKAVLIDEKVREFFPNDQAMAFLFEGVALYSDGFLLALDKLTRSIKSHPDIEKVFSVTTQDHITGTEDGFLVEPLIDITQLEDWSEDFLRERILHDRFANRSLIAPDGSALAIVVIPSTMDNSFARMGLQNDMRALIRDANLQNYLSAEAGQITTDVEQTREFLQQMMVFIPLTVVIGLVLIWLLFRRVMAVLVSLVAIAAIVGPTISLYTLFNAPFNLISSILPPLLSALTIAALVHLFNALKLASRRGKTGSERVASALSHVKRPALYNALTTMAGFASLGLSNIPPIKNLGLITAAGVGLVYVVVFHLLPPLFARWDKSGWDFKQSRRNMLDSTVRILFHAGTRHPLVTLLITALLLGAGSPFLSKIVVETNLLEFFAPDHKIRLATEHLEEKLAGTGSLDILLTTSEPEGLSTPQSLNAIKAFQTWAESRNEVDKTTSFADFVEDMHWGFNSQQKGFRIIPDNADLISQYLFIYDGTDLYDFVDENFEISRIALNLNIHGAKEIQHFMAQVRSYIDDHPVEGVSWEIAGMSRMFSDQVDLLITGQITSILGALVIIFVLMLLQWRSLKDSLVCMLPNLAPVMLIFIMMGAFNLWLDVATAMIASVAVGIAIDDTIHIFHGFIHRIRNGATPATAIVKTYQHAGRAVMTTTIILCAQFMILAVSDFVPIKHFGLLTSIGLLAALLFDLLVLPAILILVYRRRINNRTRPDGTMLAGTKPAGTKLAQPRGL